MKALKSILLQAFEIFCHLIPVSSRKVYFSSFAGQYNDNPKAISIKLHEMFPEIKQYWSISEKSKHNDLPDYINEVKYGTFHSIYVKNRCKVVVENGAGSYIFTTGNKTVHKIKKHLKNKKQFDLSTWHGNPIKHIGAQIPGTIKWTVDNTFSSSDMLLAGCQLIKDIFEQSFINLMPVELLGTPRTDILFNESEELREKIKKKLGLPSKKIVLYAPTYRYSPKDSGITQLQMIDFEKLFNTLQEKFGGEWIFVMRVHNMVLMEIQKSGILDNYSGRVFDGNKYDDMNEYLYVADVLISDYSGCIYDVALTEKPCFLFAHDKENYEERERGLYTPLSTFPYPFANSFKKLLEDIACYQFKQQNKKRIEFLNYIGNIEDGYSSERVVKMLFSFLKRV